MVWFHKTISSSSAAAAAAASSFSTSPLPSVSRKRYQQNSIGPSSSKTAVAVQRDRQPALRETPGTNARSRAEPSGNDRTRTKRTAAAATAAGKMTTTATTEGRPQRRLDREHRFRTNNNSSSSSSNNNNNNNDCSRHRPSRKLPWAFGLALVVALALALREWSPAMPSVDARRLPWTTNRGLSGSGTAPRPFVSVDSPQWLRLARGGGGGAVTTDNNDDNNDDNDDNENDDDNDDDEERYSRQVYTMGARAHGLIRSSTVYVDGPIRSGLLWESIKNLALSGVGKLVLIVDDEENENENDKDDESNEETTAEQMYHLPHLDDLGATYIKGALGELGYDTTEQGTLSSAKLVGVLVEFLRRLNPALEVSTASAHRVRSHQATIATTDDGDETCPILLCIDRPVRHQKKWNALCRKHSNNNNNNNVVWKFVAAETAGVYGKIFCDFGPHHEIHDADGETPLVIPLDRVSGVDGNTDSGNGDKADAKMLLVKSVEGERHDVSWGDIVLFQRSDGSLMEELPCRVKKVKTPELIEVEIVGGDDFGTEEEPQQGGVLDAINAQAVAFSRQKQIRVASFESLENALQQASSSSGGGGSEMFTPCDLDKSFDDTRRKAVFGCFQALDSFVQERGTMPSPGDDEDAKAFLELARDAVCEIGNPMGDDENENDNDEWEEHCLRFLRTCPAKLVPLQAIFGAIASQECLKAVSGLYTPVQQFLLYDCDEILTENGESCEPSESESAESTGLSFLLGSEMTRRLRNQKVFVVGSGAIGCELLKNIAAMGAGTGESGGVVVTDMDTIEKSNLSRQLLFRDSDIGKFKSKAAEEALLRMNPSVRVESHTSKVGDEEDPGPFDSKFWSQGVDVILNALDNMEARLFMDDQCVSNQKAMVDAGTLGSKGNVQVVVPHQSESYGSSVDPPEPGIPVCTLKNFPYAISHTIQWGRDLFDGLYVRRPNQANQYAQEFLESGTEGVIAKLDAELGDEAALEAAKELVEDLSMMFAATGDEQADKTSMKRMAIEWAVNLGKELFHEAIVRLLEEHPIDELDEEGELFWSGSRKPPRPLSFSTSRDETAKGEGVSQEEINDNTIDFVRSAARLRYETYTGIPSNARENLILVTADTAKNALFDASENGGGATPVDDLKADKRTAIRERLSPLESFSKNDSTMPIPTLSSAEFEKDDESNDHITFITAASNLRAICYGIAPVDAMETRKVAGNIIPAMITTTAFVSALSCLELIKLTQGLPLNRYRNAFINLALPFFAFTAPLPAEEYPGVRGDTHTLWDKITIKEGKKAAQSGGLTLKRFLKRIQKKAYADDPDAVQVSNISIGPIMVYANFLHEDDEELLGKSIWEVIENAVQSGEEFDEEFSRDGPTDGKEAKDAPSVSTASYIDLAVSVEDTETFDEVELPHVRLFRSK